MPEGSNREENGLQARHHGSESSSQWVRPGGDDAGGIRWEANAGSTQCDVRQQVLFSALRDSDLEHLRQSIRSAVLPVGTALYQEGAPATAVYTLGYGLIKLIKQSPAGERIVRLLGPGAAAGLDAYFSGHYRHTAVALRPTGLCRIPLEVLREQLRHNGGLAEGVLAHWQQQLESADRWLAELGQGVATERMERLIAILAELEGGGRALVQLPPTADVASMLGITRESVSRALNGLRRARTLRRVAPHTYEYRPDARH